MGVISTIIGVIILVIIIAIVLLIIYAYFIDKGGMICGIDGIGDSIIFGSLCKCPDSDGKDLNGDCYTCPTINGAKTGRTPAAVTAANACSYSRFYTANTDVNCNGLYGSGSYEAVASGKCYRCPSGKVRSAYDLEGSQACGDYLSVSDADKVSAIYDGPSVFPAAITNSILCT